MDITEAIVNRRSIRAYRPEPVPKQTLQKIIDTCQWAGSFINMQPWEFAVLGGEVMKEWKGQMVAAFEADSSPQRDYPIGNIPFPEPYGSRAEAFRSIIDNTMFPPGTPDLAEKQHAYTISGIQVRDAPNAIVVCTKRDFLELPLHLMAIGIIIQNICLAALDHGIGTCIMGRPVETPGLLRKLLNLPDDKAIMLVVAMGYPDTEAPINNIERQRAPQSEWVHWHGC